MDVLSKRKLGFVGLEKYCAIWKWPRGYSGPGPFRVKDTLQSSLKKWSASEQMALAPVLHKYLTDVVAPVTDHPAQVLSCIHLCVVVMMLMTIMTGGEHGLSPKSLEAAILKFLAAHQAAWGTSLWIMKHHLLTHLGHQWAEFGFLLATFLMERMHRDPKREAQMRHTTRSFEHGLVRDVTVQQVYDVADIREKTGLEGVHCASRALAESVRADFGLGVDEEVGHSVSMRTSRGRRVLAHDVVRYLCATGVAVGEVYFHVEVRGFCFTLVATWTLVESKDPPEIEFEPRALSRRRQSPVQGGGRGGRRSPHTGGDSRWSDLWRTGGIDFWLAPLCSPFK